MDPILGRDDLSEPVAVPVILVRPDVLAAWLAPWGTVGNGGGQSILFLDLDGPIIPLGDMVGAGRDGSVNWRFRPGAVMALRRVTEAVPAASIVISSSWRVHGLEAISDLFNRNGCEDLLGRLHSDWCTPVLKTRVVGWDRIREIDAWLNDHDVVVTMAIDDDPAVRFRPWGVRVDPVRGLTLVEADAAIGRLIGCAA
jgi:hypothetical protein